MSHDQSFSQQVFQAQVIGTTDAASPSIPAIVSMDRFTSQNIKTNYDLEPIHRSYGLNHNGISDAIREIVCLDCYVYLVKDIENVRYRLIIEKPETEGIITRMTIPFAMVRKMPLDIQEKIRANEGQMISKCLAQGILNEVAELTKKVSQQEE